MKLPASTRLVGRLASEFHSWLARRRMTRATRSLRSQGREIVHFLHIGKTGGVAFKTALRSCQPGVGYHIVVERHGCHLDHLPRADKFCFLLRDPVRRFASAFNSRLRMGRPLNNNPWNPVEARVFTRFTTPNELAEAIDSSDAEKRSLAHEGMRGIKHVKSSYWTWFRNERYFISQVHRLFFVGFQETLSEDFSIFCHLAKLPDSLRLPSSPVQAHRTPEGLDAKLSERGEANIRAWYRADYRLIEICRAWRVENG